MPEATVFTAGGANQQVDSVLDELTLGPGTYGSLSTSEQNQKVTLSSGNYYFDSISAQGFFTLEIDLTTGDPAEIYVVGDATFQQNSTLMVKGAGTGGGFVPISAAPELAALIYMETHQRFVMGGENVWGGTVYASLLESNDPEVQIGQYIDWYGAAYAFDSVDIADHGTWTYVPIPEPGTLSLLFVATGLLSLPRRIRR